MGRTEAAREHPAGNLAGPAGVVWEAGDGLDQRVKSDPVASPADMPDDDQRESVETIAGLFAAASLFMSLVALGYRPVPISVTSVLLALIASGMSDRHRKLCALAVLVAGLCFVAGLTISATTDRPLW